MSLQVQRKMYKKKEKIKIGIKKNKVNQSVKDVEKKMCNLYGADRLGY